MNSKAFLRSSLSRTFAALALLVTPLLGGCAASGPEMSRGAMAAPAAPAQPVLSKSLFARDPSGSITEDDLQKVLSTGIDIAFPARVGVLPLEKPFDPSGKVSVATRSVASKDLARALVKFPQFSQVSDVSTDLQTVGGIEGLRTIAARYRLRYLVLYSEHFEDDTHVNAWGILYPTIIGIFVTPSVTVASHGIAEADLIDVRTGTILASSIEPLEVDSNQLVVGAARKHRKLQKGAAEGAAAELAQDLTSQVRGLLAICDEARNGKHVSHFLPPPVDLDAPVAGPLPGPVSAPGAKSSP